MRNRREFMWTTGASLAVLSLGSRAETAVPRLKKAVKIGMVEGANFDAKFALLKKVGFEGVEMDSPGLGEDQKKEAKEAAEKHGIVIHGVVNSTHWSVRHSDPSEEVRKKAMANLETALKDAAFWKATTVLLVPGAVKDPNTENFDQVWERSTAEIKKALPLAKDLGVKIAIEVVWNNFITKSDQLVKYVDQFESEWLGAYFDCSNMLKYGETSADWMRKLGKRMMKFDFKGYSIKKAKADNDEWAGFNVQIGEGDENWPEVLKALDEIGYTKNIGWATSEVGAGGEEHLKKIAAQMDAALGLAKA